MTGRRVIVSRQRYEYVKRLVESVPEFIDEFVQSTEASCPFCPERVEKSSPKFPSEICSEGRIRVGEAICFPSLFAHEDFNGIVVPTKLHRIQLNEFSSKMLSDALKACLTYFDRVHAAFPDVKYAVIAMNFLPPAGSTVAHPHIQALASDVPFQAVANLVDASRSYAVKERSNYWHDLIETEKRVGTRYLRNLNGVDWITPFAPVGLNEADAIAFGRPNFNRLSDTELNSFAEGIVKVLKYYYDIGVRSFNTAIYSGPLDETDDSISVMARIVSRYGYKPKFVSDVWTLQYLLGDQEVFEAPEELCARLMRYFQ